MSDLGGRRHSGDLLKLHQSSGSKLRRNVRHAAREDARTHPRDIRPGPQCQCLAFARDVSLQLRLQFFVIPQGKAGLAEGNPMNEQPLAENYILKYAAGKRKKKARACLIYGLPVMGVS